MSFIKARVRPSLVIPPSEEVSKRAREMVASEESATKKVAKLHEILDKAICRRDSDFFQEISTKPDEFHTYIFVDLDNVSAPSTLNAPPGVALICVGKENSFRSLISKSKDTLVKFLESGSLFCFAAGEYKEAADDRINFIAPELARVVKNRDSMYIFLSHGHVYSITAECVESHDLTARTSCIHPNAGFNSYTIQQIIDGALLHPHRRVSLPPMSVWVH
jgi:hypothetical protein